MLNNIIELLASECPNSFFLVFSGTVLIIGFNTHMFVAVTIGLIRERWLKLADKF